MYTPWCHGGSVLCYINKNIPSKTVNVEGIKQDCEIIKTCKWLCIGLYKLPSKNENNFLDNLSFVMKRLTCQYENFMLIGDFNVTIKNKNLEFFINSFALECLIKKASNVFPIQKSKLY